MTNSSKNHTILYRYYDNQDQLLYVGITNDQSKRFSQHKVKEWMQFIHTATFEHFENRKDAEFAEINAIKKELPLYNISHHPGKVQNSDTSTIWFHSKVHLIQMLNAPDEGHDEVHQAWSEEVKSWIKPHECWDFPWDTHIAWHLFAYQMNLRARKVQLFKAHQECSLCAGVFESEWYQEQVELTKQIFKEAGMDYYTELRKEFLNEH